jgi:site-specific recombinase XerD
MKQNTNEEYGENIYHFVDRIEKEKQAITNNKDITQKNKELILEFCKYRKLKKKNTNSRICKLLNKLKLIAIALKKDFDKVDDKDIENFLEYNDNRKDISEATKSDYLIILKVFYKWLLGSDKTYPKLVEDIKTNGKKKERLPSEILNEEDIIKMIDNAHRTRDKALISLFADSGIRLSELINLKISNLLHSEDTIKLVVETGKTGGRSLILIPSVPYIISYLNSLPKEIRENSNNILFLKMNKGKYINECMTPASINNLLRKVGKYAKINKSVNPHSFRRFSATNSSSFMTDTQLMLRYGWKKRNTIDSYTFLNPKSSDDVYMQKYGIKKLEIKESPLTPIKCSCGQVNPPNSLCSKCGKPNTLNIAIQREEDSKLERLKINSIIEILSELLTPEQKERIVRLKEIVK